MVCSYGERSGGLNEIHGPLATLRGQKTTDVRFILYTHCVYSTSVYTVHLYGTVFSNKQYHNNINVKKNFENKLIESN